MTTRRRLNGTGSVRQLPSGMWQARIRLPNTDTLRSPGYTFFTRLDAQSWLDAAVQSNYDLREADRRTRWDLRLCRGCSQDFRPSSKAKIYCDDCGDRRHQNLMAARAIGTHTADEWAARLAEYQGICAYCRTAAGTTKDHVVPVSRGGSDAIDNIVPACQPCNSSKRDASASEFRARELSWPQ